MIRTNAYTDENGYEGAPTVTDAERYARAARAPMILGGPAAPVGTVGPRRAAEPTDADLLAALMASPDFEVFGR